MKTLFSFNYYLFFLTDMAWSSGPPAVPPDESHLRHHGLLQVPQGEGPLLGGGAAVRLRAVDAGPREERGVAGAARSAGPVSPHHHRAAPQVRTRSEQVLCDRQPRRLLGAPAESEDLTVGGFR